MSKKKGTLKGYALSIIAACCLLGAASGAWADINDPCPGIDDGTEVWVNRYNGPANSYDGAEALVVDSLGNVYVTGVSYGENWSNSGYATVKYNSAGAQLWVSRYNYGYASASALAVDSVGNVYVTGSSQGESGTSDYTTVKYDSDGNEQWVRMYTGTASGWDYASAIAVDGDGNVYVTGSSGSLTDYYWIANPDYATVKYDSEGNQLWVSRYDGPANSMDSASALAVDGAGNVYVTGGSDGGSETGFDYATVKYDSEGNQLWVRRYDGPANNWDSASALAVDSAGNVYVTGGSGSLRDPYNNNDNWTADTDYATVKYDSAGHVLWVNRYDGPANSYDEANSGDYATALAVDSAGNVYITGGSDGGSETHGDYATVKYNSAGNQLWVSRYNSPTNDWDVAVALAVDGTGNVYVTGGSELEFYFDMGIEFSNIGYATVKYDSNGNEKWVRGYTGQVNGWASATDLAVDSVGNVYVTGRSYGGETETDYATIKYGVCAATVDTAPPTSFAIVTGTAGDNGWYLSGVTVEISASDTTSGIKEIRYSVDGAPEMIVAGSQAFFSITSSGLHNVSYYALDNAGNQEAAKNLPVKIDTNASTTLMSIIGTEGENGWYLSGVTVQFSSNDAEGGVRGIHYSINGGLETVVAGANASFSITNEGENTITYYASDNAGNYETSNVRTIKIDAQAPSTGATVSGNQGANGWYLSGVTAVLSATDASSGIKEIRYSIDGGAEMTASGGSVSLTITGEGTHTVSYHALDIAGNTSANDSRTINIDTLPPATEAAETGNMGEDGWYRSDVTIVLTAGDAASAVKEIRYTLNNGSEMIVPGAVATVAISAEGINTINYHAVDNAGNAENNRSRTVKVDKSNPVSGNTLSGQLGCAGWYTSNVQAQLQANDAVSGVKDLRYRLNSEEEVISPVNALTLDITTEGINNIAYSAKDNAGNYETGNSQVVKIDKTLPVSVHTITGTAGTNDWYVSGVTLELSATDTVSGVKEISYQINGAPEIIVSGAHALITLNQDGNYTITYHAVDNACLVELTHTVNVKIDQTAPIVNAGSDIRKIETETVVISSTVTDNLDANPHVVISPLAPYPLGTTTVTVTATDAAGNVGIDTLTVTIITVQQAAVDLKTEINNLPEVITVQQAAVNLNTADNALPEGTVFKNNTNERKRALTNKIDALISIINAAKTETNPSTQDRRYDEAIEKLTNDIQGKMDGCINGSSSNDWIISCPVQVQLNELINKTLTVLRNLRNL